MTTRKPAATEQIDIIEVSRREVTYRLVGETPLIMHRLSEKARHELLLPRGRLNATAKATSLKHDPVAEYRAAAYVASDPATPTYLVMPSTAFKDAIRTAAIDLPGANKSQIGRLTYVIGDYIPIYGIPELHMSIVRMSDMARTPDVRTRPIIRRWACELTVRFTEPILTVQAVSRLVAAAGMNLGVGDWRQEKGSGDKGLWKIVGMDDPDYPAIVAEGGRAAQVEAMKSPSCYDDETAELLAWFDEEMANRWKKGAPVTALNTKDTEVA